MSANPSTEVTMLRSLGSTVLQPRRSRDNVLYWRGDIFNAYNASAVVEGPGQGGVSERSCSSAGVA